MITLLIIAIIAFDLLYILPVVYGSNSNYTNATKALEGKECPMLPSSEISSLTPLRQMRCHDPECQLYFFSGNYTASKEMDEKCYEPGEDRTLGSLVS
jgi:hypothetical protein